MPFLKVSAQKFILDLVKINENPRYYRWKNMKDFYRIIGEISCSFAMTDFALSNIAADTKLEKTPYHFYARKNMEKKTKKIHEHLIKVIKDENLNLILTNGSRISIY